MPGGTLRVAVRDLGSLDPATARGRGSILAVAQVFDSLTAIDPATGGARPAAAGRWQVSSDGLRWTFHVRPATFHDGRPVTAADFKLAFDRIARRRTGSDAAFQLEPVRGFAAAKIAGTASSLAGVRALDHRRLEVRLDRPFAELAVLLAHPALGPVEVRRYGRSDSTLGTRPVGNGPMRVAGSTPERSARLVRNDDYYGGAALLDALELSVVRDPAEGWREFLAGRVEVTEVPASEVKRGRDRTGARGFTPLWAALYFGLNLRLSKYAKPVVRRAISLAIDREAIARTIYGGTRDPATGILPRGVRGFEPEACRVCALDRDRAKTLLAAAFGPRIPPVTVDHLNDPVSARVAGAVASNLREVGVRATLRAHTSREYVGLLQAGRHDLAELAWVADVPTPDGFLAQQLRTRSRNNPMSFADPIFDARIDRARAEREERRRLSIYRFAEARALELMPLIPIVFFRNRLAIAGRVRGLVPDGSGLFDAARVWLAPAA